MFEGGAPRGQQFHFLSTSLSMGSLAFAESLRKFCGKFVEICTKIRLIASGKGAEFCVKLWKFRGHLRNFFLQ